MKGSVTITIVLKRERFSKVTRMQIYSCDPYLSSWKFFQESVRFVRLTILEVWWAGYNFHIDTAVLSSDLGFESPEVLGVCVESLNRKECTLLKNEYDLILLIKSKVTSVIAEILVDFTTFQLGTYSRRHCTQEEEVA